jgi:cellulose synthase/poly-beta-1,6-N-acetylglucosamine synthase-like glycosyltransferase
MLEWIYVLCVILLATYGANSFWLTLIYWFKPRPHPRPLSYQARGVGGEVPIVTVQLPIYNELFVVERLLKAVSQLAYPADRLQIQVLDDSTDETCSIVDRVAARLRARGAWVEVCRRANRVGYKGGALAAAMATVRGEFIAIFDADFVPSRDFLRRVLPYFADTNIGCVQTRWEHLNDTQSLFTQVQAIGTDGHFIVEQEARNRMGWFMAFNGSAGVWRKACIEDAGGWSGDTLTEDLDLSYRAQLAGWRFRLVNDITVPAELPAQMDAYKRQQFRWAKGSVQVMRKLLPALWRAPMPFIVKLQGTLALAGYFMHPLMVMIFLLALPMSLSHSPLLGLLTYLTLTMIGPTSLYGTALWVKLREWPMANSRWQMADGRWQMADSRWRMADSTLPFVIRYSLSAIRYSLSAIRFVSRLVLLIMLGTGMSLNNTRGALEALLGIASGFKRTPKFAVHGRSDAKRMRSHHYTLPRDPIVWAEISAALLAFVVYGLGQWGASWHINQWMLMYGLGYGYVAALSLWEGVRRVLKIED